VVVLVQLFAILYLSWSDEIASLPKAKKIEVAAPVQDTNLQTEQRCHYQELTAVMGCEVLQCQKQTLTRQWVVESDLRCCLAQAVSRNATDSDVLVASACSAVGVVYAVAGNCIGILLFEKIILIEWPHAVADAEKTQIAHDAWQDL